MQLLRGTGSSRSPQPRRVPGRHVAPGTCRPDPAADPVERGRVAYAKYCATCHGLQANGYVADNAPSLRTATFLATATDAFLRDGIVRGRPGTAMAAYGRALGGPLVPEDVEGIIAFLRVGGPARVDLLARPAAGDAKAGKVVYAALCTRCALPCRTRSPSAAWPSTPAAGCC